jgi:hypothetical protein
MHQIIEQETTRARTQYMTTPTARTSRIPYAEISRRLAAAHKRRADAGKKGTSPAGVEGAVRGRRPVGA